ncbi:hypothetical protein [Streptomyces massasporeus]|uniref:hypothetical protein n=1 Tax=Streptomyces massasporeus TaxID=67324 RepID=UPI0016727D86|nr:hypothetical protein [Streptomyces massasporeus]GGV91373.1 hypothetical protein GCM10010228_81610 [Streptomyces massasporeus]
MDAGLAALFGAGIGALGSGTAAFISGRFVSKQAQTQAVAQAETARIQVRADHLLQLREPRARAYSAFLDQGLLLCDVLSGASFEEEVHEEPDWEYDEHGVRRWAAADEIPVAPSHDILDIQRLFASDNYGRILAHGDELKALDRLRSRVVVEGPAAVARPAQAFRDYLVNRLEGFAELGAAGGVLRESDRLDAVKESRRLLERFAETAREALSDNGLKEQPPQEIS